MTSRLIAQTKAAGSRAIAVGDDRWLADRLLQTLHTFALLAHALEKLFKCHTLLAMLGLLRSEPLHMGGPHVFFPG
jgi:hypothetical protein